MGFPLGQGSPGDMGDGGTGGAPQSGDNGGGVHPAWNEMLGLIPPDLHSQVIPHLRNWDANVNKVHQRYEPYKEFLDNKVDPGFMRQALSVAQALQNNPEGVYQALHEQFGTQTPPGQQQNGQFGGQGLPGQGSQETDPYEGLPPQVVEQLQRIDNLQNGFDTMAEIMLSQRKQAEEAEQDAELDRLYQDLEAKNPVFAALNKEGAAEPYINSLLQANYSPEQAMEMFMSFVDAVGQHNNRPKPPVVLGSGGSMIPSGGVKPGNMSRQQTRDFVTQTLLANQHANQ